MSPTEVTLNIAGARVMLPAATLTKLWLDQLAATTTPTHRTERVPPRIGAPWRLEGGIYAGVARGQDGAPDYHVIVHEDVREAINWKDALAWADGLVGGTPDLLYRPNDFTLPTRHEQALLYANVPELFAKEWYWSNAQYAGLAEYAWSQHFTDGYQTTNGKTTKLLARAVRRVPIE